MESYKQFSFAEILPIVISKYADKKALGFMEEEAITYSQMGTRISAVKAFLTELGIRPDDKVVIYSQNMPNWGIVYFALHCMGVVVVPVLPDFNKHELQNVLHHSEAKAIFVSESLEYKLSETKKDLVETIISIDNFDIIEGKRPNVVFNENTQCSNSFSPNENKLAILLYTSGTTGNSKGVMLSQKM